MQSARLDTLFAQRTPGRRFISPPGMQAPAGRRKRKCDLQLSLFVRWHSPAGKTKVTRLQLRSVGSLDCLQVWRAPVCACAPWLRTCVLSSSV